MFLYIIIGSIITPDKEAIITLTLAATGVYEFTGLDYSGVCGSNFEVERPCIGGMNAS